MNTLLETKSYIFFFLRSLCEGCLYSSVAEHWSRKPGVVSSNLTGGIFLSGICPFLSIFTILKEQMKLSPLYDNFYETKCNKQSS